MLRDKLFVRNADTHGAKNARKRTAKYTAHAQRTGDGTGVLSPRAAERRQHIIANVVPFGYRDLLDRPSHVGVCDFDKSLRQGDRSIGSAGRLSHLHAQFSQFLLDRLTIQAEGKKLGHHSPKNHVHVRDREWSAVAVTGWTRVRTGAMGADHEFLAVEGAQASATGCHSFDSQHGRHDTHAGLDRIVRILKLVGRLINA